VDGPATDPYKRAAETKKQRTRASLTQAAREVMQRLGMSARVEDIATSAGVSTPTFYNFYKSRNDLCLDAFYVEVAARIDMAADAVTLNQRIHSVATAYCGHHHLLRAALLSRLEHLGSSDTFPYLQLMYNPNTPSRWSLSYYTDTDLITYTAWLIADDECLSLGNDQDAVSSALTSAALLLIDLASHGVMPNTYALANGIRAACAVQGQPGARTEQKIVSDARKTAGHIVEAAQLQAELIIKEAQDQKDAVARQISELMRTLGQQ
jgi:AcrR family transcriptional regulator